MKATIIRLTPRGRPVPLRREGRALYFASPHEAEKHVKKLHALAMLRGVRSPAYQIHPLWEAA